MTCSYPDRDDFKLFVEILREKPYRISKYLPHTDEEWLDIIVDAVSYVAGTSQYIENTDFYQSAARLLYKVAKRHELNDGNKRSAVIATYLFCIVNDWSIKDPAGLKQEAIRAARSRGRQNEAMICNRIAEALKEIIIPPSATLTTKDQ